jgi:Zn-dependent M16 (insulinase) family peptidase
MNEEYSRSFEIKNLDFIKGLMTIIHLNFCNNFRRICHCVFYLGVEVDDLTIVADKYSAVLYSIINSQTDNDQFYIQLQRNIKKEIESHLNQIENEPYDFLIDTCCLDHISELSIPDRNTDDEQHLHKFLRPKAYLESLFNRPITYWHELIKKYLLEWDSSKRTIILLKPSNELLLEQQGKQ